MSFKTVDTGDTESLPVDDLHIVEPRAAGLDVHKMCITAAVRLQREAQLVAGAPRLAPDVLQVLVAQGVVP